MSVDQRHYQVRFEWGRAGAVVLAPAADVVVWVDVLGTHPFDAAWLTDVAPPTVAVADLRTAGAAARWAVGAQQRAGRRLGIAVIAAGRSGSSDGTAYAVEDLLGAGAVVARLGDLGVDATSPEAAVAEAAFRGLERAVGHLVSASVTGRSLGVAPATFRVDDDLDPSAVTIVPGPPTRPA